MASKKRLARLEADVDLIAVAYPNLLSDYDVLPTTKTKAKA